MRGLLVIALIVLVFNLISNDERASYHEYLSEGEREVRGHTKPKGLQSRFARGPSTANEI